MVPALAVAVLLSAAPGALGALPPYDVTGHWTGVIIAASQAFSFEGDLTATNAKKFTGDVEVNGVPCTVRGKRKKKVKLRLVCLDGTKGKLKGLLYIESDAVIGTGRLKKNRTKVRTEFVIEKVVVACGNGTVEAGEECDDGNTLPNDGCDAFCQIEPPVCGNGTVEVGEECDDGNTVPGDGCDALCRSEIPFLELDEIEPNDSPAQATEVVSLPAIAHGSLGSFLDEDFYRIDLAGTDLVLETFDEGGPGSCGTDTDTIIELRGPDGTSVVAIDDDGGPGVCSRVELHGLTPGVYYPCVRGFFGAVPAYQLRMIGP